MKLNLPVSGREATFDETLTIVTKTDLRGTITYVSPDFCRASGFEESELLGQSHNIVRHPEMSPMVFAELWRSIKDGESWCGIIKNRCKNGDHYWVYTDIAPIDDNGKMVGYISTWTQPSRQQIGAVFRRLLEIEHHLARMVGNLPGFGYTLRRCPQGLLSIPFASKGIRKIYGLQPGDVSTDIGPLLALIHPNDLPRIMGAVEMSARDLAPILIEIRVLNPARGELWVEVRSTPEREPDGSILWYGVMIDVTERRRVEERLRQREREFRTLVENSPDSIVRYDRDCRRIYASPAYEKFSGIAIGDVLGKTPVEFSYLPAELAAFYQNRLMEIMENGVPADIELSWEKPDGEYAFQEVRAVPEFGEGGRVTSILTIARDISAIRETERRLEDAEAMAHLGYWQWDHGQGRAMVSAEVCRIFGKPRDWLPSREEVLGMIVEEDRVRVLAGLRQAYAQLAPEAAFDYRVRAGGRLLDLHSRLRITYAARYPITTGGDDAGCQRAQGLSEATPLPGLLRHPHWLAQSGTVQRSPAGGHPSGAIAWLSGWGDAPGPGQFQDGERYPRPWRW